MKPRLETGSAIGSRRRFIGAAATTVAGLVMTGRASAPRAASGHAARGADAFTVIDTHTHFYDPSRPAGVSWPPRDDRLLHRTVLPRNYLALSVPRPVTGTVVVEASPWVEDNQWVLDLAARESWIVGVVGNLPVGTKAFAGHLKRFAPLAVVQGIVGDYFRGYGRAAEEQVFARSARTVCQWVQRSPERR